MYHCIYMSLHLKMHTNIKPYLASLLINSYMFAQQGLIFVCNFRCRHMYMQRYISCITSNIVCQFFPKSISLTSQLQLCKAILVSLLLLHYLVTLVSLLFIVIPTSLNFNFLIIIHANHFIINACVIIVIIYEKM